MKQVAFYLMVVVTVICAFGDVTALQLLPLAAGCLLMGLDIFSKDSYAVPTTILAVLMTLLNLDTSLIDVIVWLIVIIAFFPRK